jgi:hypothetical protein
MELFTQLFGDVLAFVYHCFDRMVIYGYLSGLSRPEQVVHFFRNVVGVAVVRKDILSQRTADYQAWVEAYARNHRLPLEWAEKGECARKIMSCPGNAAWRSGAPTASISSSRAFVVPKGVMHCTRAPEKSVILMVETAAIVPTGDA